MATGCIGRRKIGKITRRQPKPRPSLVQAVEGRNEENARLEQVARIPIENPGITATVYTWAGKGGRWPWRFQIRTSRGDCDGGSDSGDFGRHLSIATAAKAVGRTLMQMARESRAPLEKRQLLQAAKETHTFAGRIKIGKPLPGATPAGKHTHKDPSPKPSATPSPESPKGPGTSLVAAPGQLFDTHEPLSTEERRALKKHEAAIERGARAWVEMACGLIAICDGKLFRATPGPDGTPCKTFNDYLELRRLDRSTAYGMMKAYRQRQLLQDVAGKKKIPRIELDRESQYRSIPADATREDLAAIAERIGQKAKADKDGTIRPTAAVVREAVSEETAVCPGDQVPGQAPVPQPANRRRTDRSDGSDRSDPSDSPPARPHAEREEYESQAGTELEAGLLACPVETISQACFVLRSWVLQMSRQFAADELSLLDEELYQQCQVLRDIYRPQLAVRETAHAKTKRRAK